MLPRAVQKVPGLRYLGRVVAVRRRGRPEGSKSVITSEAPTDSLVSK